MNLEVRSRMQRLFSKKLEDMLVNLSVNFREKKKEYGELKDLVKLKYYRNIGRNKISNHMKNTRKVQS